MKILFFGSSEFSVPPFEFCLRSAHQVIAVVTTPDRSKGRGLQTLPNPLKARSEKEKIVTLSPSTLKNPEIINQVKEMSPDLFVVASYGKLIPDSWLTIPKRYALNIHPSLLPRHRGAAPINWQILEGDKETGVSISDVTSELDAGDLYCQIKEPLGANETAATLTRRLSLLSTKALHSVFEQMEKNTLKKEPQNGTSSYARKLTKQDGHLDLSESADQLARKIRAFDPWPGAFVGFQGNPLRLLEAFHDDSHASGVLPGTLTEVGAVGFLRIQTGKGSLKAVRVQLAGRQAISAREFANGQRLKPGFVFEKLL
jgi:methionyl-tRNA formyltransferase